MPVLVALLALLAACGGGGDDDDAGTASPVTIGRDGSSVVADAAAVVVGEPVASYAITYRVEEADGDDVRVSRAELTVRRPYASRLEIFDADDELVSSRVADFGYVAQQTGGDHPVSFQAVPAAAPGDVRGDLVIAASTSAGEVRRISGRTCQVHAFGAPLTGGHVIEGDSTDACIDADGLLLEEVVRDGDRIMSRWIATDVDTSPPLTDDDFVVDDAEPLAADAGGGSLQEVVPTSQSVGTFFELDAAPEGFVRRGRYAIVPPQGARTDDMETRAHVIAGVVDVFERGVDVLVVDQGGTLGQVPALGAIPNSTPVTGLDAIGPLADSLPTPTGGEVRVQRPPGRYVKVVGTLPVDDLLAIARTLRAVEGTGLVYP